MKTPERFVPNKFELNFDAHVRHYERYLNAVKMLNRLGKNEKWLDFSCGSGYGSDFLSNFVDLIVGVDIDGRTIEQAKRRYNNVHCLFFTKEKINKVLKFDVVFSIETIEHIEREKVEEYLNFIKQKMKKDGQLILSTPIVEHSGPNPNNKFHLYEYSQLEFNNLLIKNGFLIQKTMFKSVLMTDGQEHNQGYYLCELKKLENKCLI